MFFAPEMVNVNRVEMGASVNHFVRSDGDSAEGMCSIQRFLSVIVNPGCSFYGIMLGEAFDRLFSFRFISNSPITLDAKLEKTAKERFKNGSRILANDVSMWRMNFHDLSVAYSRTETSDSFAQ